jgi:predicted nucleic acid-binding Zn ribbon protein
MPIFAYKCPVDQHVTDHLHRVSSGERPPTVPCKTCGADAQFTLGAPAPTMGGTMAQKPSAEPFIVNVRGATHDIRCPDIECTACKHRYFEALLADEAAPPCPRCGEPGREMLGIAGTEAPGSWPRYDKGLGLVLTSAAHRRQVCKERGLIAIDGDWDEDRLMSAIEADVAKDEATAAEYYDRIEHAPEYREYREARDKGVYDSVLKKEPPKAFQVKTKAQKPNRLRGVKV